MKTILIPAFFCLMFMSSCTKTDMSPVITPINSSADEAQQAQNLTNMLTAHPWMYQEYYSHYVNEQNKGQRFYDRDSTNNLDQYMENSVYTFHKNHTFVEYVKYNDNTAYNNYGK